eukprot:3395385-Rhodomonas_salina.1
MGRSAVQSERKRTLSARWQAEVKEMEEKLATVEKLEIGTEKKDNVIKQSGRDHTTHVVWSAPVTSRRDHTTMPCVAVPGSRDRNVTFAALGP